MAAVNPIEESRPQFYELHGRLMDNICRLRVAKAALDQSEYAETDETVSAVASVLRETLDNLSGLYDALDGWHVPQ